MNVLGINKLEFDNPYPDLDAVSDRLDAMKDKTRIDRINWKDFSYRPEVEFSLGYTDNEILLKYYITEKYFKADKTETNEMVCEDSCVEFFVSPAGDGIYYNIEFNGIGTCLLGTGTGRENITRANSEIIKGIRRKSSVKAKPSGEIKGDFSWTITIAIPVRTFFRHDIKELKGKTFRANFYKCGDMLSVPHYVTWNPVGTERPDFHRPEYFGKLKFI